MMHKHLFFQSFIQYSVSILTIWFAAFKSWLQGFCIFAYLHICIFEFIPILDTHIRVYPCTTGEVVLTISRTNLHFVILLVDMRRPADGFGRAQISSSIVFSRLLAAYHFHRPKYLQRVPIWKIPFFLGFASHLTRYYFLGDFLLSKH